MPPRAAKSAVTLDELAALIADLVKAMSLYAVQRPGKHLTTADLAERLGVSPRTVDDWRVDKKGPAYIRIGRGDDTVRYRLADVEAWEAERLVTLGSH